MLKKIVRLFGILTLLVVAFSILPPRAVLVAGSTVLQAPTKLLLTPIPPTLPADKNTYPAVAVSILDTAGHPSISSTSTAVYITSSQLNVGKITNVTILAGKSYAIANLTTSVTPGTTIISASSVGLASATTTVTTVTPSGYPTHLRVFAVPGTTTARPNNNGSLVVEVQDDTGLPAKAVGDTRVALASSNTAVADVPQRQVTILSGQVMTVTLYTTGFLTGTAFVTASSSAFFSGSAGITVSGPAPLQLNIAAQPPTLLTSTGSALYGGRLVISLTDTLGNPARAAFPIQLTLTSSNLTTATLPQTSVTIPYGEIYTLAHWSSTPIQGQAVITVSSPGLSSSFATVQTYRTPALGPATPISLALFAAPNPVAADNRNYASVIVALLNKTGFPTIASSSISVTLTSSASSVGTVDTSVTIPAGVSYQVANFKSTFSVGLTTLTASAQNLLSIQAPVQTYGQAPYKIAVIGAPSQLPADGGSYTALGVMLQSASGAPAIAPKDIAVQLFSSRSDILNVSHIVLIKKGLSFNMSSISTKISPGGANITAFSPGLVSGAGLMSSVSPAPAKLALYIAPASSTLTNFGNAALLAVQLQDYNGNPARARQQTSILVTASNSTIFKSGIRLSVSPGSDYAFTTLAPAVSGTVTLTASAGGLPSASATLTTLPNPVKARLTLSAPAVGFNSTVILTANVTLLGSPVDGAKITWLVSSGSIATASSKTGPSGLSTVVFTSPTMVGTSNIVAMVSSPATGKFNLTGQVSTVAPPAPPPKPSLISQIFPYLPIVGGVAVVAVLGTFFFLRRKRAKKTEQQEESWEEPIEATIPQ